MEGLLPAISLSAGLDANFALGMLLDEVGRQTTKDVEVFLRYHERGMPRSSFRKPINQLSGGL